MKSIARIFLLAIVSFSWTFSTASAQTSDGWWFLKFEDTTGAALQPLNIGIDLGDGSGFSFLTLPDDDGDGMIHLPPVPNGGRLALGVDADGEVGCDIWEILGTQVVIPPTTISHPPTDHCRRRRGQGPRHGLHSLPPNSFSTDQRRSCRASD